MTTRIESRQNPRIKELQKLTKRRRRDEQKVTLVEGFREAARAVASGIIPIEAYICNELFDQELSTQVEGGNLRVRLEALDAERRCRLYEVPPDVYEKIAYRSDSGGILLLAPYQTLSLEKLPRSANPFFVVVENVEKPGNLGAILRTADAAGIDGVIVANSPDTSPTDVHNPNAIRASLGTLFSVPLAQASTAETIRWLRENKFTIVTTSPDSHVNYASADLTSPIAVVMGSEADGVSPAWFEAADIETTIPMHGIGDSLNLSTSTAILLYEVVRQRAAM